MDGGGMQALGEKMPFEKQLKNSAFLIFQARQKAVFSKNQQSVGYSPD